MADGGTTPLSNKRRRENPGNGPLGWPSLLYIQLSGGAAAAGAAGTAAGAVVAISGGRGVASLREARAAINAVSKSCSERYAAVRRPRAA